MDYPVAVTVTTRTEEETLRFTGSGTLQQEGSSLHLHYTAPRPGEEPLVSAVHLWAGRVLVESQSLRLLLDPKRRTRALLKTAEGAAPLEAQTHRAAWRWDGQSGAVELHYTICSGGRALDTLRLTLELTLQRREPT